MAIQQGAIGLDFDFAIVDTSGNPVDISNATTLEIVVRAPSTTVQTWAATASTLAVNRILYTTVAGNLNESGIWQYQARVVFPDGDDIRSSVETFRVEPNLS